MSHCRLQVDPALSSLNHILASYTGTRGGHGQGERKGGCIGPDTVVPVPPGTLVVFDDGKRVDLCDEVQQHVAALGGAGGLGNVGGDPQARPADPDDARLAGGAGEARRATLELKSIADVGLVGLPNAGKSSLLAAVSRAQPRVAPFPFTTLNPHLGVVHFPDTGRITLADVPGLAIGAANNVGLGHAFLRHIERCRVLVLVIDARSARRTTSPVLTRHSGEAGCLPPADAVRALQRELAQYSSDLLKKRCVCVSMHDSRERQQDGHRGEQGRLPAGAAEH